MWDRLTTWLTVVSIVSVLSFSTSVAAGDMFLGIDGLSDCGSQDTEFRGSIDVLAWSFGSSNSGTLSGGGGGAGKGQVQDLSVTKFRDSCSPDLFLSTLNGQPFKKAQLDVRMLGIAPVVVTSIILEPVLVTSVSTGGSDGEERLTENITLSFSKITMIQWTLDERGQRIEPPTQVCWDTAQNIKC